MLLLETAGVHAEHRQCLPKVRLEGYHKVPSDQYCESLAPVMKITSLVSPEFLKLNEGKLTPVTRSAVVQ